MIRHDFTVVLIGTGPVQYHRNRSEGRPSPRFCLIPDTEKLCHNFLVKTELTDQASWWWGAIVLYIGPLITLPLSDVND